jgi:negative regulator of flagellin synthesis FlgM
MPIDIIGKSTNKLSDTKNRSKVQKSGDGQRPVSDSENGHNESVDTVSLTSTATTLQQLESALENVPVVDIRHVREVREQLEHGTYHINPIRVAIKLLALEFGLGFRSAA